MSVLDSQASAINALGAPPIVAYLVPANEFACPDRRCTLIGDKANVVYAAVYNAGHVRYIGFMHTYLDEQELSQPSDNGPRQILAPLPVVVEQPSIISADDRKHPVPTAQETPQPHRR